MKNAIQLKGPFVASELPAAGTISPGMLVRQSSATACNVHATEGGYAEKMVAVEDALQGRTVADNYASGDPVQIHTQSPGAMTLGLLKAGYNYTAGALLVSAGDGTFMPYASSSASPKVALCSVVGAVDLSASNAVNTLSEIRWL